MKLSLLFYSLICLLVIKLTYSSTCMTDAGCKNCSVYWINAATQYNACLTMKLLIFVATFKSREIRDDWNDPNTTVVAGGRRGKDDRKQNALSPCWIQAIMIFRISLSLIKSCETVPLIGKCVKMSHFVCVWSLRERIKS